MGVHSAKKWHSKSIEEVAAALGTDPARGLSSAEARSRLEKYGYNELREQPRPGFWHRLLDQLNEFLVLILIASAIISFFIGLSEYRRSGEMTEFVDAGAIMAIVILNAILGVVQEGKAEEALAALKKMAAPNALVLRDGHQLTIPARELVPGDVVILETGNYVPADVRLIESVNLRIEEASLTGESVPVGKDADRTVEEDAVLGDRYNCGYMSTIVTYGRGKGIVVATGMQTEIGKIAEMIQSTEEELTPLQIKLDQLGKWLGVGCLVVCGIVGVVGITRDPSFSVLFQSGFLPYLSAARNTILEMFMIAVSLAIAAVPEGLPAVVTICLALGMQEMVKRHALIRRLPAVETLGSATAICSDKTGTLTQNEMTAVQLYVDRTLLNITGGGYNPEGEFQDDGQPVDLAGYPGSRLLLRAGLLCNDARLEKMDNGGSDDKEWRMVGDPTEGAFVVAAAKAGLWREELEKDYPRLAEIPFDSGRKRMTTIHPDPRYGGYVAYVKGAPDVVLELCEKVVEDGIERPLNAERRKYILEVNEALASNALRVLGVAYRPLDAVPKNPSPDEVERDLTFVGLLGMIDPARPEVKEAIALARHAGIRTMMITGDYPDTARAIAKEIDLLREDGLVLTGADIDRMGAEKFTEIVEQVDVCARVSPEHKMQIVDALKAHNHVVAMTGDGVNDAPALKRASIGVAMGITGTDVTKETADMVLTDDNYASIVSAVEEGRVIYSNIRKFVYYLLSCNVGEILTLFLAMIAGMPVPLTAIQLLVLNLVTDGAPALALGVEKGDPDIMDQPPRPVNEPIINRVMIWGIVVQTIAITTATLTAFIIGLHWYPNQVHVAQTMAFTTLSISELLRAYTSRSERYPLLKIGIFSNKWMQWAVLASFIIILAIIYVPVLDPIFDTAFLGLREWAVMLPFISLPAVAAEVYKVVLTSRARQETSLATA
ncbi:MAG: cation-translocating P-type ATPase [Anaerolineae bacterium]|nr:cation-translocating P-type ATPase [Anaerolineae bacterium]